MANIKMIEVVAQTFNGVELLRNKCILLIVRKGLLHNMTPVNLSKHMRRTHDGRSPENWVWKYQTPA